MTTMSERGKYIVIEGADSIHKVKQARMLVDQLNDHDIASRYVHEPWSLPSQNPAFSKNALAELLRLTAYRAELFEEKIEPGLTAGEIVVADGNWLSSLARQGVAQNLGVTIVRELTRLCLPDDYAHPDFLALLYGAETTRDEKVQKSYDALVSSNQAFSYISTDGSYEEIHNRIVSKLQRAKVI